MTCYLIDAVEAHLCVVGNLKSHYRINHSPENQLQCVDCQFTSSSQKLLREHMKQHTSGKNQLQCVDCQFMSSSQKLLREHMKQHTSGKLKEY